MVTLAGLDGRPPPVRAALSAVAGRGGAVAALVRRGVRCREGLGDRLVVPLLLAGLVFCVVGEGRTEALLGVGQGNAVLGSLRAGQAGHHGGEVELELLGVARLGVGVVPEALFLGVGLDESELLGRTTGELEVVEGLLVDREDRDRRAELRAHVADGGAVGQRQRGDAGPVELHELPDHAVLAQHLGDGEHQVGRRRARGQVAVQLEADHSGDQHADGLTEHRGLGLDAPDAPADHADAVDHGGVGVGADAGVGVGDGRAVFAVAGEHHAGQVLDVDLVDDAGAGRHDLEVLERALPPAQELVALAVALVLDLDVAPERLRGAEDVGDDRVVDDQLGRRERVDLGGVAAEVGHRLAHRRQVDDAGHPGEVLHDHARRRELDLLVGLGIGVPAGECLDVVGGDVGAVLGAQQVLEQDLEAERQARDGVIGQPVAGDGVQPIDLVGLTAYVELALRAEAVLAAHRVSSSRSSSLPPILPLPAGGVEGRVCGAVAT